MTPLDRFGWNLPTRIRFGPGVAEEVGDEAGRRGGRIALVIGHSIERNAAAAAARATLDGADVAVVAEVVASGEPDDAAVIAAAATIRMSNATVVVAIGGGSAIDTAKAAAVLIGLGDAALPALLGGQRVESLVGPPVIALPTTAGSGSEVSHGAIVLDRASERKRGIRGPGVAAAVALVDPRLTVSAPSAVTAAAGFDAVAHAVETAVSRAATPVTLLFSADALGRLLRAIPRSIGQPDDLEARSEAAYAALLMGANLANSTTCLPHRLQYPVGAMTGSTHALGVAALFPAWLQRAHQHAAPRLAGLARGIGAAAPDAADETASRSLIEAIDGHLDATGARTRLRDLGIQLSDIPRLVGAVEGTLANDPGPIAPADLAALYRASW